VPMDRSKYPEEWDEVTQGRKRELADSLAAVSKSANRAALSLADITSGSVLEVEKLRESVRLPAKETQMQRATRTLFDYVREFNHIFRSPRSFQSLVARNLFRIADENVRKDGER